MPRNARIDAPGALHHIMARGIDGQLIFRSDVDREDFIRRLDAIVSESKTRCFAWAFLPNHFHLLVQTGVVPLASIMRRLMTGYAVGFNRRHQRHGHLFQNRYKSVLCDEDAYLRELVRYIHLNPLRAGVVEDLDRLARYPYAGHSAILGRYQRSWQACDDLLAIFGRRRTAARQRYRQYVADGADQGRRDDLTGGGLVRSLGGWTGVLRMRRKGEILNGDERILGDSAFVTNVLDQAQELLDRKYRLAAGGVDFDTVLNGVANFLSLTPGQVKAPSKIRQRVRARSLVCFWSVRELGLTMTDLARRLNQTVSAVSIAVQRGERLAQEYGLRLEQMIQFRDGTGAY